MSKEYGYQNFTHPKRHPLFEFCEFTDDRDASEILYTQGHQFELEGKLDEAVAAYSRAIKVNSQFAALYQILGNVFAQQGEVDKAITYNQQASGLHGWHLCGERDYQFINNWFSENIPVWEEHLQLFAHKAGVHALEIGSYQGMSTCWLLDNILTHASARIVCVDFFCSPYREQFDDNVIKTGVSSKVTKIANCSQEALPLLKPNIYDFIYIDGSHQDKEVLQDAILSWNLVKVGGLMIFDDYEEPGEQSAKVGTDWFLSLFSSSVNVIYKGYQVIARKTSSDVDFEALSSFLGVLSQEMLESIAV